MTPLTRLLLERLHAAPARQMPFANVMELALYHPEWGYYGPGPRRLGRGGDFFTAVSVGPLFGRLLARLADQVRGELGSPPGFTIIEQGAHDGQLAADVLAATGAGYLIVEPNAASRQAQEERLAPWADRVRWVPSLAAIESGPALFICNELPDAMPVHLVRWDGTQWHELFVTADLTLVPGTPSSAALAAELERLPRHLPAGCTREVGLAAIAWMRSLGRARFHGAVFIADYGLDDAEFEAPERSAGTLRRYRQHRIDDRVLEDLGESDLTSHVNFTRLIEEAAAGGMPVRAYEDQGRFLGRLALDWLKNLGGQPPDAAVQSQLRQFHTLTHPAFMGRSFRILMLDKFVPAEPPPAP